MASGKIVLIMEYNGARYHGLQLQIGLPTIQGETEKAIWKLTGERSRLLAASRTDAGVHAKGQTVSFRTDSHLPPKTFVNGLNHYLPRDIAVKTAYRVEDSFDVRRDALNREYNYYIWNSLIRSPIREGFCCFIAGHLDIEAMNQACQTIIGRHNFASFATCIKDATRNTIRNMYRAEVNIDNELATLNMVANSFLTHQVRNTVGALIKVGLGRMTTGEFQGIAETQKPGLAGPTAPACGLYLTRINYPRPFEERHD